MEVAIFYTWVNIMNELFCNESSQRFPVYTELPDLRSTLIANCVFNNCLTYTYAIRKASTMARTLKTLLLSLACSNVAVGLFSEPLYTFLLIKWPQLDNPSCNIYRMLNILGHFFSTASFFGIFAVSVDSFLAAVAVTFIYVS